MTYCRPSIRPLDLAVDAAACCWPYPQAPPGSCNPGFADPTSPCYLMGTC